VSERTAERHEVGRGKEQLPFVLKVKKVKNISPFTVNNTWLLEFGGNWRKIRERYHENLREKSEF